MIVNDMFNGLIGNEAVKTQLTRLVSGRRVPNSLIFAGPDGIGKREFALRLARSFVCRDQACGTCSPCLRSGNFQLPRTDDKEAFKRIVFSEHADVGMILPYNRSILVDAIRELVLGEVNVKELVVLDASESKLTKKIKPIFPKLGATTE